MTTHNSDTKEYYPDEQVLFTIRSSAKKRMITSAIFALFILVIIAGILVFKNLFVSLIGAASLTLAFWPLSDAYERIEVTNIRIKRSDFAKKTSKAEDIMLDQLFFLISPNLSEEKVVREIIDLGIANPQVVHSANDPSILYFFELYPYTDYIRDVIALFRADIQSIRKDLDEEIKASESLAQKWKPSKKGKTPREHQVKALEAWVANGRHGIFEHATGSGKTFTAMCAIHDAFKRNEVVLVLVPSRDLLHQWDRELRETLLDDKVFYLLCGDSNNEWKKPGKLNSWSSPGGSTHRIIISIMDTASTDDFLQNIYQGEHLFVVADEVHRLGSPNRRKFLSISTGARLGLSATPRRYGDSEGTHALFNYFGGIIPPPFTLKDAIDSNVLTKYFYNPLPIHLTEKEQEDWNELTKQISTTMARLHTKGSSDDSVFSNSKLKHLLIDRSRIVKNAAGKVDLAINLLRRQYVSGQRWIVYCDNITQLKEVLFKALDAGFDAYEYYAEMDGDRGETLRYFERNGGVLVSIKCLDEGVDIPSTTHALILASSQNPREFIQRRGRILRKAEGKIFAHLYDAIAVPSITEDEDTKALSIIVGELSRAIQFGHWAENPACVTDLKNIAIDFQIDYDKLQDEGMEDDND